MEGIEQAQPPLQPAPASKKAESTGSSAALTPPVPQKSTKPKEAAPPPLPGGGGLLAGMPFGGATPTKNSATEGTNIWLTFPLKGQTNVTINFAREVEKKYGFAALHPRVAAARERRRQMAAATAALERGSGAASADDMSVDLSENESNVDMGGMEDDLTQEGKKRQRKKKVEDYDKDDDFIDDTELAWEQSALMAKDGFFVYSGPLITEGEKPAVERFVYPCSYCIRFIFLHFIGRMAPLDVVVAEAAAEVELLEAMPLRPADVVQVAVGLVEA